MYHNQCPKGVVEKDGGGYHEHACADERTELWSLSITQSLHKLQHTESNHCGV
jgi:hypothetical protein